MSSENTDAESSDSTDETNRVRTTDPLTIDDVDSFTDYDGSIEPDPPHTRPDPTAVSVSADEESSTSTHQRRSERDPVGIALDAHVDTEHGAGALTSTEDWVRANHRPPEHDGRSPTRTYFDPRDVSETYPGGQKWRKMSERRSWATLAKWQDGVQSDISRGGQNWWADKMRWTDTFGEQLHATDYHVECCKAILEEIELEVYSASRIPVELVIVGILSLLIDSDVRDFSNRTLARDNTKPLLEDLEQDVSAYENVRSLLREHDKELLFPA